MKSVISLLLVACMAIFLAGPAMANPVTEVMESNSEIDDGHQLGEHDFTINDEVFQADNLLAINENDNSVSQGIESFIGDGDATNSNMNASNIGSGQRISQNSINVQGGSVWGTGSSGGSIGSDNFDGSAVTASGGHTSSANVAVGVGNVNLLVGGVTQTANNNTGSNVQVAAIAQMNN